MILLLFCRELVDRLGKLLDIRSQRVVTIQLIPASGTKIGKVVIRTPRHVIEVLQEDIWHVQAYLERARGAAAWDDEHAARATMDWQRLDADLHDILVLDN